SPKSKGLPITQLGLALPDIFLLASLKLFKPFFYVFKFGGYLVAINKGVRRPITNASMFGLISPLENSAKNLFSLGEFFQEYWIAVNEEDASLHPMCNSLLLYNMLYSIDTQILNSKELSEAKKIYELMKEKFNVDLKRPTVGFRVGFAKTVTDRSPRKKVIAELNSDT
ncbi:MAG: hypothetical protein K2Q18_13915, partial [Bdellovibrionales bacterium]|nr:hypothetical protein [Bdellovibrionales bacterium]